MNKSAANICYGLAITFLATGFMSFHMYHVSTLFENDRHFSHLSDVEREMSFRSEMGFYFHYYKIIVEASSFRAGLAAIERDNLTEYPNVIDATEKFNIYPEIIIGGLYRLFIQYANYFGIITRECWEVTRGAYLTPVTSCEGIGDPFYFYLEFVWCAAGLTKGILFLFALYLSGSLTGALLTILSFLYNHTHSTRVQWAPPLRESFGYPLCLLQIMAVSIILRNLTPYNKAIPYTRTYMEMVSVFFTTFLCLVCWQFSPFVIATQTIALLFMYTTGVISKRKLFTVVIGQMFGLIQAYLCLENVYLLQSALFSLLWAVIFSLGYGESQIPFFSRRSLLLLIPVVIFTFTFKVKINEYFGVHDAHIFHILLSKVKAFHTFHTLIYTCSPEFDFLPVETLIDLTKTGLLPLSCFVILVLCYKWLKCVIKYTYYYSAYEHNLLKHRIRENKTMEKELLKLRRNFEPDIYYNVLQLAAFTIMATFIMRLKLFWTPHLCLISSLVMSAKCFPWLKNSTRGVVLAIMIGLMSYQGIQNVVNERSIIGEYTDLPLEDALNWIKSETKPTEAFCGPMSVMANVLLSTRRPIINHPHYEHSDMRDRTIKVYSIFSRQKPEQVYQNLFELGANYVILEAGMCFHQNRKSCSMIGIWDTIDLGNRHREPVCPQLFNGNPAPFTRVFSNEVYVILSLRNHRFVEFVPSKSYQM